MITPFELSVANRILNDIRREFMIKESETYEDEIKNIVNMHIWDVLANLQMLYEKEAEFVGKDMEKNAGYNE